MIRNPKNTKQLHNKAAQLLIAKSAALARLQQEIKIEASLEKVRKIALGMRRAEDMLSICKSISQQLTKLGISEIRNVQTAIFYESRGAYMNYEYYAKHDKTFITETSYTNHRLHKAFAAKMLRGKGQSYITHIKGKKVKDWIAYQKTTNVFIDPFLKKVSSLNYYWHSLGPVALGISTYSPLKKEEHELFQRFLKVFELSYRRYLDIEKATAQARESQIEAALERIRARALAMHKSEEFTEVAKVMREQMGLLGQPELETSAVHLYDEDVDTIFSWRAFRLSSQAKGNISYGFFKIPKTSCAIAKEFVQKFRSKATDYTIEVSGAKQTEWYKILFRLAPEVQEAMKKSGTTKEKRYYHFSKFTGGALLMVSSKAPSDDAVELQKRSAQVFDLAYRRFKDLQKAEAQSREAQIEVALERIRAAAMAMRTSAELSTIIYKLYGELTKLDAKLDRCFIMIVNPENKGITWWMAGQEGLLAENGFFIPMNQHPSHLMYLDNCKKRKKKWTYLFEGKEKRDWDRFGFTHTELARLPEPVKKFMAAAKRVYLSGSSDQFGSLVTGSFEPLPEEQQEIISRFAVVFNQAYTRFLDLQKAEAQARESQIQLALERIRARTMAMQNSEELADVSYLLNKQVVELGIPTRGCAFNIYNEHDSTEWFSSLDCTLPTYKTPRENIFLKYYEAGQRGETLWIEEFGGDKIKEHYKYLYSINILAIGDEDAKKINDAVPDYQIDHVAYFKYGYLLFITLVPAPEAHDVFKRFAKEFEQTYTRFLDLQKAEAQAREAQIEAALERIRSISMAIRKSSELLDIIHAVFEEWKKLGLEFYECNINLFDTDTKTWTNWGTGIGDAKLPNSFLFPWFDDPFMNQLYEDTCRGTSCRTYNMGGEVKKRFLDSMFAKTDFKHGPEEYREALYNIPELYLTHAFMKYGSMDLVGPDSPPESIIDILKRFAKVFEQAYTRYLDVVQAEAQAREAQIEAALERVRSRTMAMHKSDELPETSHLLFEQMKELGEPVEQLTIGIVNEESKVVEISATLLGDTLKKIYNHSIDEPYMMAKVYKAWKKQQKTLVVELRGDELNAYNQYRNELTNSKMFPTNLGNEHQRIVYAAFFSKGMLALGANEKRPPESLQLLVKFASVFDLTYTRFLDLQEAEARAREAQIETALERVRSRSMGMQKSEELKEVIKLVYQQLIHLNIKLDHAGFVVDYNPKGDWTFWIADEQDIPSKITHPYFESVWANQFNEAKENGADYFVTLLNFEEKNKFYNELLSYVPGLPETSKDFYLSCPGLAATTVLFESVGLYIENFSGIPYTEQENAVVLRFGKVFQQTYTRFLDLQKAEAQAREAQIEMALEKVRSRTMAMQNSNEIQETAAVLFNEFKKLGTDNIYQVTIGIYNEEEGIIDFRSTSWADDGAQDNRSFSLSMEEPTVIKPAVAAWKANKKSLVIDLSGEALEEWLNYRNKISGITKMSTDTGGRRVITAAYYSKGHLSISTPVPVPAATLRTLERFAAVFDSTYTRFLDLEKAEAQAIRAEQDLIAIKEAKQKAEEALTELQATQKQLIQSEKMASLGELTAGIAHEIQNPLNFVNNFSEVSAELVKEMVQEVEKGNTEEVKEIAEDVVKNLEKINHHGKRAADIVKGMLQHSRSGSGAKEPTDINALCNEYLRLAYHGLRAKDKSFNAKFETQLDPSVGMINVMPQDMGRVILNLINNAFYAVSEKKKEAASGYEPTVMVVTQKTDERIIVSVKDNGHGIPQKVIDKIFQPFFTTKPTGQGTGLGLSLSYDIVNAHEGELNVETKEGEGTNFIILLPIV